jgi:hypothetical protein
LGLQNLFLTIGGYSMGLSGVRAHAV